MINYKVIANAKLSEYPYRSAAFEDIIPYEKMERLRSTFPKDNFIMYERRMGHDKTYKLCGRHFIIPGEDRPYIEKELSNEWLEMFDVLMGKEYQKAMEQLVGISLKNSYIGVDFWRFDPGLGCYIGPHADVPWKIATHVFYFTKEWKNEWGGKLRIHDCEKENDIAQEILPSMHVSAVLLRSDRSFHSIQEVKPEAEESRKVLDVVFYNEIPPAPRPGRLQSGILLKEELCD